MCKHSYIRDLEQELEIVHKSIGREQEKEIRDKVGATARYQGQDLEI